MEMKFHWIHDGDNVANHFDNGILYPHITIYFRRSSTIFL